MGRWDKSNNVDYNGENIGRRDLFEHINYDNAYLVLNYAKYLIDVKEYKNSYHNHLCKIYRFVEFLYEEKSDMKILDVSECDAEQFVYFLSESQKQNTMYISVLSYMVSEFYDYLIMVGKTNKNPFLKEKKLMYEARKKKTKLSTTFLTDEQIEMIKNNLPDHLKLYAMFSLSSGAKIIHVMNAKWNQVDFDNRIITLDNEILYFSKEVSEMLQLELNRRINNNLNDCGYIFRSHIESNYSKDTPISKSTISNWCTQIGELIGAPKLRHLDFRHSAIHKLLSASGSVGMTSIILNYPFLNQKVKAFIDDKKNDELLKEYKDICEL